MAGHYVRTFHRGKHHLELVRQSGLPSDSQAAERQFLSFRTHGPALKTSSLRHNDVHLGYHEERCKLVLQKNHIIHCFGSNHKRFRSI